MEENIEHWNCSVCDKPITSKVDNDIESITHFDIERSNKSLSVVDNAAEEELGERNTKMSRQICEECFVKILNESKTLGKLFLVDNAFIY